MLKTDELQPKSKRRKKDSKRLEYTLYDLPEVNFQDKMAGLIGNIIGPDSKNQKVLAIVLMATAGLFLTLGNSLVQFVYMKNPGIHISSFQVLFVRSMIQLFFTVIFMIHSKVHPFGGEKKNVWSLCLMGIVEAAAIVLVYLSLEKIPVGDSTVIQFTAPVFTMIFSFCITKVCCSFIDGIFGSVSFIGVVFIAKPSLIEGNSRSIYFHQHHRIVSHGFNATAMPHESAKNLSTDYIVGGIFALAAAICLSWFYILNKMNGKKTDVTLTILYPSIFGMLIAPFAMLFKGEHVVLGELNSLSWGLLFIVGFVAFIGLMFMAEALQLENPGPAVLIRNMDVIYAFVFQFLFVHQPPGLSALIGTIIVITCSSVIAMNRVFGCERKCKNKNIEEKETEDREFLLLDSAGQEEEIE